jgi:RNA polymerase sigma-70 factor (sigma-E family)
VTGWPDEQFEDFVAARLPALVGFAFGLTGDLGHSQDLVQTALLSVYMRSRHRAPGAPEAYVRKAIVNAYVSGKRRRRVTEHLVALVPEDRQPHADTGPEERDAVANLVKDLSPRQRAVLVLRYHEDWSEDQIAAAMGVSTGTVKKLAARGLAALRVQLRKQRETAP